ncbi:hypothetical protein SDC9_72856 [bioreactor metagenome]|uniref:VWFA domain-containing protein n=1 Tax=bioreactor metagenome TaxID=1076179 RepID=A0A644YCS5_9ZZZZ
MKSIRLVHVIFIVMLVISSCAKHEYRRLSSKGRGSYAAKFDSPSAADSYSWAGETDAKSAPSAGDVPSIAAGQLTAGEVNDFTKWELWEDIDSTDLASYNQKWKLFPDNRFVVQVTNSKKMPVHNAVVSLKDAQGNAVWKARTDNTGKAELWSGIFTGQSAKNFSAEVHYQDKSYPLAEMKKFHDGINFLELPVECSTEKIIDIAFMIDATGSMGDEINYMQAELADVISRVRDSLPGNSIRLAIVFYRDQGDAFVVKSMDFSSDIAEMIKYLGSTDAGGGGDFPEAVDQALDESINKLSWSDNAVARLLFPVLDAPPHDSDRVKESIHSSVERASQKGIRIVPVSCSGIDKSTEYFLRSAALATNGTYVFLTNHSGIGNSHIEPTTDEYEVEYLNDALVRIILSFSQSPDCDKPLAVVPEIPDTAEIALPLAPDTTIQMDSVLAADTVPATDTLTALIDSVQTEISEPVQPEISWRYYPNPTGGPVTVEIINLPEASEGFLYLTDMTGKLLNRYEVKESFTIQADISMYPTGTYFLTFFYGDESKLCAPVILIH